MKSEIWLIVMLAGTLGSCNTSRPQAKAPAEPTLPMLSLTHWGERTELFMEYPELVRGGSTSFAVHLTDLATFKPLADGVATLEFEKDGKVMRFDSKRPSRRFVVTVRIVPSSPRSSASLRRAAFGGCSRAQFNAATRGPRATYRVFLLPARSTPRWPARSPLVRRRAIAYF